MNGGRSYSSVLSGRSLDEQSKARRAHLSTSSRVGLSSSSTNQHHPQGHQKYINLELGERRETRTPKFNLFYQLYYNLNSTLAQVNSPLPTRNPLAVVHLCR